LRWGAGIDKKEKDVKNRGGAHRIKKRKKRKVKGGTAAREVGEESPAAF